MKGANLALPFALVFTLISVASSGDFSDENEEPRNYAGVREIFRDKVADLINDAKDNARSAVALISKKQQNDQKSLEDAHILGLCKEAYQSVFESRFDGIDRAMFQSQSGRDEAVTILGNKGAFVAHECPHERKPVVDEQIDDMVTSFLDLMHAAVNTLGFIDEYDQYP